MNWQLIVQLEGRILHTLYQENPFEVVLVETNSIRIRPNVNNVERTIRRNEIEGAYEELISRGEITRQVIRLQHSDFNPAYVAAIIAALPDMEYTINPIRIYCNRR